MFFNSFCFRDDQAILIDDPEADFFYDRFYPLIHKSYALGAKQVKGNWFYIWVL